eukprot:5063301-Pyramimonas_sp.AAC.1
MVVLIRTGSVRKQKRDARRRQKRLDDLDVAVFSWVEVGRCLCGQVARAHDELHTSPVPKLSERHAFGVPQRSHERLQDPL